MMRAYCICQSARPCASVIWLICRFAHHDHTSNPSSCSSPSTPCFSFYRHWRGVRRREGYKMSFPPTEMDSIPHPLSTSHTATHSNLRHSNLRHSNLRHSSQRYTRSYLVKNDVDPHPNCSLPLFRTAASDGSRGTFHLERSPTPILILTRIFSGDVFAREREGTAPPLTSGLGPERSERSQAVRHFRAQRGTEDAAEAVHLATHRRGTASRDGSKRAKRLLDPVVERRFRVRFRTGAAAQLDSNLHFERAQLLFLLIPPPSSSSFGTVSYRSQNNTLSPTLR